MRNIEENAGRTNSEPQPGLFTIWLLEGQLAGRSTGTFRENPPERSSTRDVAPSISVEVKSVLPTSDRTYEVEWVETTRDLYGTVKATDHWKGYFAIALNAPKDERQARINPIGVYITNASWAKVL